MLSVDGSGNIKLTRGDTGTFEIALKAPDGSDYVPGAEDEIVFSMAKQAGSEVLLQKTIPTDTMILRLDPEDSKPFGFETFVYDIQVTDSEGRVSTVLMGKITFTKEIG